MLLKIEYAGRTLYDCQGTSPPNPASNALCTVVPPGGLAGKLHLQVSSGHVLIFRGWCQSVCRTCWFLPTCQYGCSSVRAKICRIAQENTEIWPWEIVVLIGWLVVLRLLVYVALRFKTAAPTAQNAH